MYPMSLKGSFSQICFGKTIASQNHSLFRSAPIGSCIVNHFIQIETSKHISQIIWIRSSELVHKSFDSDPNFRACIIWFKSELWSGFVNCYSVSWAYRELFDLGQNFGEGYESFDLGQNFRARIVNYLI